MNFETKIIRIAARMMMLAMLLAVLPGLQGQPSWIAKTGWSFPQNALLLDKYRIEYQSLPILGIELKSGHSAISFYPAVYFIYNSFNAANTLSAAPSDDIVLTGHDLWIKTRCGFDLRFNKKSMPIETHFTTGLCPGWRIFEADLHSLPILKANYRKIVMESYFGLYIRYRKVTLHADYHIGLIRHINTTDKVQNNFYVTIGLIL